MSSAQYMDLFNAVTSVGEYMRDITPATWNPDNEGNPMAYFPVPDVFIPSVSEHKPSMTVRLAGLQHTGTILEGVVIPPIFVYEVRIYYPLYDSLGGTFDGYETAQMQSLWGESELQKALFNDETLGGLVRELNIESTTAGELIDPDETVYYGHESIYSVLVY